MECPQLARAGLVLGDDVCDPISVQRGPTVAGKTALCLRGGGGGLL